MPPAARVTDMHTCPMVTGVVPHVGGPVLPPGHPTTLIGSLPAARIGDMCTCVGPPDTIVKGSPTVLIGNMPAARMGDNTAHGGVITVGHPTTLIGDAGSGGGGGGGAAGPGAPAAAAPAAGGGGPASSSDGGGGPAGPASISPAEMSVMAAQTQHQQSAETGAPVCEECERPEPGKEPAATSQAGTPPEDMAAVPQDASPNDLDDQLGSAPIQEEPMDASNEPEFGSAVDKKKETQKRVPKRPYRNEDSDK